MKELSKSEKIIIGIVAVVLVGFLVSRFVLDPQSKKIRQLRKELASLNEQTTSIHSRLVEFNQLHSELIKKKGRLAELEQALSKKAETAEVMNAVSSQARNKGLRIQQIRPQTSTVLPTWSGKQGEFRQLFLRLGILGQYEQLGNFLVGLEQQPFYVKVAELHVNRSKKGSSLLEIQLTLEIVVRS